MTGLLAGIAVILKEVVAFLTAAFENHGAHGLVACEIAGIMACLALNLIFSLRG
jgi:hypothetical protein